MKIPFPKHFVGLAIAVIAPSTQAALVSGWGYETGFGSGGSTTITETVAGSFTASDTTVNNAPRALIDFGGADTAASVAVGQTIIFSGTVAFDEDDLGNIQFRIGMFNTNGNATGTLSGDDWIGATNSGWLGYLLQMGGTAATTIVQGRTTSGAWLSGTGAYTVGSSPTATAGNAGTYDFSLAVTRDSATTNIGTFSIIQTTGGSYTSTGTFADTTGASAAVASYDAVGFLLNGSTGGGSFSNLDVSVIPEPASALLGLLGVTALLRRRR